VFLLFNNSSIYTVFRYYVVCVKEKNWKKNGAYLKKNCLICRIVMSAPKEYDLCYLYITLHKDKSGVLEGKLYEAINELNATLFAVAAEHIYCCN
jgi:hypothetical protein